MKDDIMSDQDFNNMAKVGRLCRDATFHAIMALNEINNQSQRLWSEFSVADCQYHLRVANGYLSQINEVIESHKTSRIQQRPTPATVAQIEAQVKQVRREAE